MTEQERNQLLQHIHCAKMLLPELITRQSGSIAKTIISKEIERITGCSRTILVECCRAYHADPGLGLVDKQAGGNSALLNKMQGKNSTRGCISTRRETCLGLEPALLMGNLGQFWIWRTGRTFTGVGLSASESKPTPQVSHCTSTFAYRVTDGINKDLDFIIPESNGGN